MRFETTDLVIKYPGQNRPALNGVNMSAPSGNFYAVLGPNGSGKSTLMKGLLGIAKADQGRVLIAERNVSNWDRKALARVVGVVSQSETVSFPITVREMVGMGRYPHLGPLEGEGSEDKVAVHEALEVCDVTHLVNRDLSTLSGGELQRVRIARALAQEPMALILDEPWAGFSSPLFGSNATLVRRASSSRRDTG